jgi:hypothetical protein
MHLVPIGRLLVQLSGSLALLACLAAVLVGQTWGLIGAGILLIAAFGYEEWYFGRAPRRQRRGLCPNCGYDLTGNVSGVCPECGTPVKTGAA